MISKTKQRQYTAIHAGRRALSLAIAGALAIGLQAPVRGQGFPAALELSSLDGANGFWLNAEAADDQAGFAVSGLGDVNGDGVDDLIIGAPYAGGYAGRSYVVFGSAAGLPQPVELSALNGSNGFAINGESADDRSGHSVSTAGDLNGDGVVDLVIGAPYADAPGADAGRSYVVFGTADVFAQPLELSSLDGENGFVINGEAAGDRLGSSVGAAGDLNRDGIDDLIIGADGSDAGGTDAGRSYVLFGTRGGFPATLSLSSLTGTNGFALDGAIGGEGAGAAVGAAGDINGDGINDVVIGANLASPNGDASGRGYVVFGTTSAFPNPLVLSSLSGADGFAINGEAEFDFFGQSVSAAGDVSGDGLDDVVISARLADANGRSSGRAYVVFGSRNAFASPLEASGLAGTSGFIVNGEAEGDSAGRSVSAAGDVNNDGFGDFVIGALFADPNGDNSGRGYVVFGSATPPANPLELASLNGQTGFVLNGEAAGDRAGFSVSDAGDINGDGVDDLLIGANEAESAGDYAGRAYVVYGRSDNLFADSFEGD
ncbi:MAG: integrin alpha [Pseudomonadota bacterium]